MKLFFLLLPLAGLAACGNNDSGSTVPNKDELMSSDIDGMAGWLPDPNALVKGKAHSGQYSLSVDQNHEFSPGYTAVLGQLSPTRLPGVTLSAWVYVPDRNATAKLEFAVKDAVGGKEILRDQTKLEEVKAYGEWVKISKKIMFPPTVTYASQIVIYVSRAGATEPVYVDDIQMTAVR